MKSSPLSQVKERFGDKAKLVAAVQALATEALWLDRVNPEKGLGRVSNAKLLKLHASLSRAKDEFGSRDKLIDAILGLEKRTSDEGAKARLGRYSLPRLLARHSLAARAAKREASQPAAEASPSKAKAGKKKES